MCSFQASKVLFFFFKTGEDAVIVKNGRRLCGTGGALANVSITQNKAYFEVKIQAMGKLKSIMEYQENFCQLKLYTWTHCIKGLWGVGLASRRVNLNNVPLGTDNESWVLRNDGCIYSSNLVKFRSTKSIDEGDVIVRYIFNFFTEVI